MSFESLFFTTEDQGVQEPNMNGQDLDLLLSSQDFQYDQGVQPSDFSLDASASEAPTLAEGCLPGPSDPSLAWDMSSLGHPPADTPNSLSLQILTYHVRSLDTQIRSLDTRIQAVEALYRQACNTMDKFTKWSQKMEKHYQNADAGILELSETVRAIFGDGETMASISKKTASHCRTMPQ
ncbi:hypothetical protein F5B18DRAFT_656292 [Nemania serpens]|nr:hypothetical protein F5B18DRAFT_656292 [Nemania serpens]